MVPRKFAAYNLKKFCRNDFDTQLKFPVDPKTLPSPANDLNPASTSGSPADAMPRPASSQSRAPSIWALESYRAGETTQVLGLAEAVARHYGVSFETFRCAFNRISGPLAVMQRTGLGGVEATSPRPFGSPWPNLLISAGVRNEPVARWIRQASAGRTRIVFVGRVWAPRDDFDLIVVTPQYRFPAGPNVLENDTTLHRVHASRLAAERSRWAACFASLPQPRILALVGGDSGPFALRAGAANALATAMLARQHVSRGSLMVSTSSRTHPSAVAALDSALPTAFRYHYRGGDTQNPYFGMLAWADEIVVTSDSIAMISEALATAKPVALFELQRGHDQTLKSRGYSLLMRAGPEMLARDIGIAHQRLLTGGRIGRFGDAPVTNQSDDPTMARTLKRICRLLDHAQLG